MFDAVIALKWMAGVVVLRFNVSCAFATVQIGMMTLSALRLESVEEGFLLRIFSF